MSERQTARTVRLLKGYGRVGSEAIIAVPAGMLGKVCGVGYVLDVAPFEKVPRLQVEWEHAYADDAGNLMSRHLQLNESQEDGALSEAVVTNGFRVLTEWLDDVPVDAVEFMR
jgi:hypothetical protein